MARGGTACPLSFEVCKLFHDLTLLLSGPVGGQDITNPTPRLQVKNWAGRDGMHFRLCSDCLPAAARCWDVEWMRQAWVLTLWAPIPWGPANQCRVGMVAQGGFSQRERVAGRSGSLDVGSAHLPVPRQVDELYEGYCIQCRLRDGASNMQRAFSRCPPSRASRESLQELGRSLQECTEVGRQWERGRAPAGPSFGGRGSWALRKHLSTRGPLYGRVSVCPRGLSLGAGAELPCVGLCRTCGSLRGPWRSTWASSSSG